MTIIQSSETPAIYRQRFEIMLGEIDTLFKHVEEVEEDTRSHLELLDLWNSVSRGDATKMIAKMVATGILEKNGFLEKLEVNKLTLDEEVTDPPRENQTHGHPSTGSAFEGPQMFSALR